MRSPLGAQQLVLRGRMAAQFWAPLTLPAPTLLPPCTASSLRVLLGPSATLVSGPAAAFSV